MKRILSLVVVGIMVIAMVGCGGGKSAFLGNWSAKTIEMDGTSVDWSATGSEFSMEIKDGGKVTVKFGEEKQELKWTEKDGKISIDDGTTKVTGEMKDGKLVVDMQGLKVVMEKK